MNCEKKNKKAKHLEKIKWDKKVVTFLRAQTLNFDPIYNLKLK